MRDVGMAQEALEVQARLVGASGPKRADLVRIPVLLLVVAYSRIISKVLHLASRPILLQLALAAGACLERSLLNLPEDYLLSRPRVHQSLEMRTLEATLSVSSLRQTHHLADCLLVRLIRCLETTTNRSLLRVDSLSGQPLPTRHLRLETPSLARPNRSRRPAQASKASGRPRLRQNRRSSAIRGAPSDLLRLKVRLQASSRHRTPVDLGFLVRIRMLATTRTSLQEGACSVEASATILEIPAVVCSQVRPRRRKAMVSSTTPTIQQAETLASTSLRSLCSLAHKPVAVSSTRLPATACSQQI